MRHLVLTLLLPLALTGCGTIGALDRASRPLEIYDLRTPAIRETTATRDLELLVEPPVASGALDTERIMIRPAPLRAQYLPGVRWADPAPRMLQTLMIRSLTATGAFASVGRSPIGSRADYAVLSELTDFQVETLGEGAGATVRVRIMLRLARERDARVVTRRTIEITEPVPGTEADAIAAAFDRATSRALSEMLPWVLDSARSEV